MKGAFSRRTLFQGKVRYVLQVLVTGPYGDFSACSAGLALFHSFKYVSEALFHDANLALIIRNSYI